MGSFKHCVFLSTSVTRILKKKFNLKTAEKYFIFIQTKLVFVIAHFKKQYDLINFVKLI